MRLGPQFRTREIGFHGRLERGRPDLDPLASAPAPIQSKSQSCLACGLRGDDLITPDQNTPRLPFDILPEVPDFGLLPHKQNEALDLAVPVLGSAVFCLWNLAREDLCELWNFVSFLSVLD